MRYTAIAFNYAAISGEVYAYCVSYKEEPVVIDINIDFYKNTGVDTKYDNGVELYISPTTSTPILVIPETHPYYNVPLLYSLGRAQYRFYFGDIVTSFNFNDFVKSLIGLEEYNRIITDFRLKRQSVY